MQLWPGMNIYKFVTDFIYMVCGTNILTWIAARWLLSYETAVSDHIAYSVIALILFGVGVFYDYAKAMDEEKARRAILDEAFKNLQE